jgi:geranylgeranyl diphosphate synthase type II
MMNLLKKILTITSVNKEDKALEAIKGKNIKELQKKISENLDKYIPYGYPDRLWEAMRYSVLGEGKRLRAILCIESCKAVGGNEEAAMPLACSIEIIHAQSLIHDDLPCMDNDDFRRGKPSTHKQYGEAMAVLAGDALIPFAYQVFLDNTSESVPDKIKLKIINEFSKTIGAAGLVGGQSIDCENEGQKVDPETLQYIHDNKTGALYRFCTWSGALIGGCNEKNLQLITDYGRYLGHAFQISDDILDITGSKEKLGKTPGKDKASGKNTYPLLFGLEKSKNELKNLITKAKNCLNTPEINPESLIYIADLINDRAK